MKTHNFARALVCLDQHEPLEAARLRLLLQKLNGQQNDYGPVAEANARVTSARMALEAADKALRASTVDTKAPDRIAAVKARVAAATALEDARKAASLALAEYRGKKSHT